MEQQELICLVEGLQEKEAWARELLYENFYSNLYHYFYGQTNDSELSFDLTQDTFVAAFDHIDDIKNPLGLVNWVNTIAQRILKDYRNKRKEILVDENEGERSPFDLLVDTTRSSDPQAMAESRDIARIVREFLDELPAEQKEALVLFHFEGRSEKEIATAQSVSESTVKSRLRYARQSLHKSVSAYEKRTGTRIHSIGIIPLLMLLYSCRDGGFLRETVAALGSGATNAGTAAAGKVVAGQSGKTAARTVAKSGRKAMTTKIIAAVAALAVLGGGAAVAITHPELFTGKENDTHTSAPDSTTPQDTTAPEPTEPLSLHERLTGTRWYSIGCLFVPRTDYITMEISSASEQTLSGQLTCRYEAEELYSSAFVATVQDEQEDYILYGISFEAEGNAPYIHALHWQKDTGTFKVTTITDTFSFVPDDGTESAPVLSGASFSGEGNSIFNPNAIFDHSYTVTDLTFTDRNISGYLRETTEEGVVHETAFSGYGCKQVGYYRFEIVLQTPLQFNETTDPYSIEYLYVTYDMKENTLYVTGTTCEVLLNKTP